jgi:hypothetical protein
MWSVPLTINGSLTINSGGTFDANGLQLNIKGNFINSGTFTSNSNTTVFNGTLTQSITGATTFYNLTKSTTNLLNVNSNITIGNNLRVEAGTLADNGNTLRVLLNAYNAGTITYGGGINSSTQLGLHMNGTVQQAVSGSGTFGKITVDNANGVYLPIGSSILITNALRLVQGLFDIQGNLLALGVNCAIEGSDFNPFKMIQTNISFTDNGVKKTFPAGAQTFTYPIGSMGKFTPLTLEITANENSTGSMTLKAASEIHPSIVDDAETGCELNDLNNVLQYYWILRSNGISGLSGKAKFKAVPTDVLINNTCGLTSADYITARLLLSSVFWNKFTSEKFNEVKDSLEFDFNGTNDDGISGDYLAGLDVAIPNMVSVYQTINSGNWTDTLIWETIPAGARIPAGGPRGAVVYINPTHSVDVVANRDLFSYKTFINGTLNLGSTTQHRLGYVFGTGILKTYNNATLPAGDYTGTDGLFTATGGTLEYDGNIDYDVLSGIPSLRNVTFSGTGKRNLPNIVAGLLLYGNFRIQGPTVENYYDRDIEVRGNLVMSSGIYTARVGGGNPKITLGGINAQIINGSFTAANSSTLYNLVVNKTSNGVTLNSAIEISNFLTLTSGNITTTPTNLLTLTNYLQTAITGGSASSYIDGPLRKKIDNGDSFVFPIGKGTRYGSASVLTAQSTITDFYWTAEYFNTGFGDYTVDASLNSVSSTEYWKINSPVDGYNGTVRIRWDNNSVVTPLTVTGGYTNIRVAEYNGSDWIAKSSTNQTNNNYNGTVQTSTAIAINTASNPQYYTLGSIAAILAKAYFTTLDAVCDGVAIPVSFSGVTSGDLRYVLSYSIDGNPPTDVTVTSLPYSLPTVGGGTYQLTGFTYRNPPHAGPIVTGVVDNSDLTVNPAPAQPTITPIDGDPSLTFCEGGSVILTSSVAPVGGSYLWSNTETTQNVNVNTTGNYTVRVTNSFGCYSPASASKLVTVNPLPVFTPSAVPGTICFGESSQLNANISGVGMTYVWSPVGDLSATNIQNPLFTPSVNPTTPLQVTNTYTVKVTDSNSCFDSRSINIIVNRTPETGPQYHISNDWP